MRRTFVVGDVHGCLHSLHALVAELAPSAGDHLVFAGDLVDRGPDSTGVVRFARDLATRLQVTLVLGNHEERHARFRRWERRHEGEGATNPMPADPELAQLHAALLEEDVAFLEAGLLYLALPEHGALVVHAGVLPTFRRLPTHARLAAMGRPERKPWEAMLRVRHVDAAGRMVPLGSEGPHTSFWAERYDGRFGHVYFGHQPWKRATEPVRFPHATGIDLGACFGNLLACAVLEQGAPPRFVSVPGHRPPEGV